MLLLTSCTTLPKQEENVTPDIDNVYFPVFPDPYKDGEAVINFFEELKIENLFFRNVIILPYWYWLLIIQYVNDTEAAIQSLVPK